MFFSLIYIYILKACLSQGFQDFNNIHSHSPLQAEDAVEECVLWRVTRQGKHTAQHVEVEVILRQRAQQPGLEE